MNAQQWLDWAKRLHALAGSGLHFGASDFDKERYAEISDISREMLAALGSSTPERIADLFPQHGKGYSTPQIDVRGAVFDADAQILLVRERSDGLWTLPGGYADVGLSAAENVVKEIAEEANLTTRVARLYALKHKVKHPYDADSRDFYKLFFLCEMTPGPQLPAPGAETDGAAFFPRRALPEQSTGRIIGVDIEHAYAALEDPARIFYDT